MKKVDVPQILISSAAIFGIGLLWYDFNVKIFIQSAIFRVQHCLKRMKKRKSAIF